MTDVKALREVVARTQLQRRERMTADKAMALAALPALLDELEVARASEKRAWEEAAQARIDGAKNILDACEDLNADLALAGAVLDTAHTSADAVDWTTEQNIYVDRSAWQAWREAQR
jgi:hypothetical protein